MITQELADSLAGLLFPRKLWILANCRDVESIKWGKLGTTVLINSVLVEKECFKPNVFNVQSNQHVLRQMSYYNFQKIDRKCKIWEFMHEHFQAGREDLLHLVKRQPQGVPKKYVADVERRYSSRLQRQSMRGDRPNYARMEKGTLESEGDSELDAQLFEGKPSTRSTPKKRPYIRRNRSLEIVKLENGHRGISTRGRGSRRGGRKRARVDENSQKDVSLHEEECNTKDGLVHDFEPRSGKELEYVVPNAENWLYGSLQNGMDGLTEDGATVSAENNMQFEMAPEDDKSHLKHVVESTERSMNAKRQQESMLANEWSGQSYYGTRMQANQSFPWSSPDVLCHAEGRYPTVSEENASEMYGNGNNFPFFNPQSNFRGFPYGGVNFSRSMMNYDFPQPVPIQYSSAGNSFSVKMHSYSESLPPFSELPGVKGIQDNIPRTIDDIFKSQSDHTQDHQTPLQKSDYNSEVAVDLVTLDHNYNIVIKGAFDTLEADYNPLEKTIQSAMQHHDSILAQLIDEQNAERILMNGLRSRSSGESLEEPASNLISPQTSDSDKMSRGKSSEDHSSISGSLDYSTGAISWTGNLIPPNELSNISENNLLIEGNELSPFKSNESDATTVAYFLLDSTKYKKYSFTVTESGDMLIKDCVEDFNYWRTNKDVNPQTQITSPCLDVEH